MASWAMLLRLTLACILGSAVAEVVQLNKRAAPGPFSLEATHLFYAFSGTNSVGPFAQLPEVAFDDLRLTKTPGATDVASGYAGVFVSLIPWDTFDELTSPESLCMQGDKAWGSLGLKDGESKAHVRTVQLTEGATQTSSIKLAKAGVYALSITNCGKGQGLVLSGSVIVKNAHGFLGGNEYGRLPLYGGCSFFYAVIVLAWFGILFFRKDFQHPVHFVIAMTATIGLLGSVAWFVALAMANASGDANLAYRLAEAFSGLKSLYTAAMLLAVALGLGVTHSTLESCTQWKIVIITGLLGMSTVPANCIVAQRHVLAFSDKVVLMASMPMVLMVGGVACWVFRALASSMRRCKELNQAEGLSKFQRTAVVLLLALLASLAILLAQIIDKPGGEPTSSASDIFWSDGAAQINYMAALAMLMYLWAPGKGAFLADSYQTQVNDGEVEEGEDLKGGSKKNSKGGRQIGQAEEEDMFVVGDEDDHDILADDVDEEDPAKREHGPSADTIGARLAGAE
mmetsp:Transcript_41805/g.135271  ORF Transcript_41805/g.135271 Transcript_41805/m.135271 type:complete len:512 (-) Transcript_41805:107-1642(-)